MKKNPILHHESNQIEAGVTTPLNAKTFLKICFVPPQSITVPSKLEM